MTDPSVHVPPQPAQTSRRGFLGFLTWAIGGLVSLGFGVPALAYLLGPALETTKEETWLPLGAASKVPLDTPTLFKVTVKRQAGWIVSEEQIAAFVLTEDGRDFIAMSNICTHLGCRVRWIAEREQFLSPCHNGVFDKQGNVVSGPPPRPLDRYPVKVENGQILILGG
jgi:menaquinol-cytochrome c reductase iron-sulfur subunit